MLNHNHKPPTVLVILDGYGIARPSKYSAITLAKKPNIDRLLKIYPNTLLGATGKDAGLEYNEMSGSEAGHMNIGAGRIVIQDATYISRGIHNGDFFMNPALIGAVNHAKRYGGKLHVMGLMGNSDSPHSDPEHFRAILKLAKSNGISEVFCHLFTDGRDSYPKSALSHLDHFEKIMKKEKIGKIASLSGRFYAMDRAKNWNRLTKAYDAIVFAQGEKAKTPQEAIKKAYRRNLTDEYLIPTVIMEGNKPVAKLSENDSLIFFNLRSDRARQFTKLFVAMNESSIINDDMPVLDRIKNLYFVAMTNFGPDLDVHTAFWDRPVASTLPMAIKGLKQLYIAETEKYAHITYFLNGGYADPVNREDRIMIASQKVDSYAKTPEMSAGLITKNVLSYLKKHVYNFVAINYANADMVGHTGNLKATVRAIEVLDSQIKDLSHYILSEGGNLIITADHGNAEDMFDAKVNQPNTFHTKNPVSFLVAGEKFKNRKLKGKGILGNVAPTVLEILEIKKPKAMSKESLLI